MKKEMVLSLETTNEINYMSIRHKPRIKYIKNEGGFIKNV